MQSKLLDQGIFLIESKRFWGCHVMSLARFEAGAKYTHVWKLQIRWKNTQLFPGINFLDLSNFDQLSGEA